MNLGVSGGRREFELLSVTAHCPGLEGVQGDAARGKTLLAVYNLQLIDSGLMGTSKADDRAEQVMIIVVKNGNTVPEVG